MIGQSLRAIIRSNNRSKLITVETRLKLSLRSHGVCIKVIDLSKNLIKEYPSMSSVGKHFNISYKTVGRYLDKDTSYKGFMFISSKNK
jgi:hypothetical protein